MKKSLFLIIILLIVWAPSAALTDWVPSAALADGGQGECASIQDGTIYTPDGRLITVGFDEWGYNYQANLFNGLYCDAEYDAPWCQPWRDVSLIIAWSDSYLSNQDCNLNGALDRHLGYPTYTGSGAWVTNHQSGTYLQDGNPCHWTLFAKIVAVPVGAYLVGETWYAADGTEMGPLYWPEFALIQEVIDDPCAGLHGVQILSPDHAGLGGW
jgi:hypothetical protein